MSRIFGNRDAFRASMEANRQARRQALWLSSEAAFAWVARTKGWRRLESPSGLGVTIKGALDLYQHRDGRYAAALLHGPLGDTAAAIAPYEIGMHLLADEQIVALGLAAPQS